MNYLLDGLSYLHKQLALYHRASGCGTILLDLNGRVKIGKFFLNRNRRC